MHTYLRTDTITYTLMCVSIAMYCQCVVGLAGTQEL